MILQSNPCLRATKPTEEILKGPTPSLDTDLVIFGYNGKAMEIYQNFGSSPKLGSMG